MDIDTISVVNDKLFGSDAGQNEPSPWGNLDRMDEDDLSSFLDLDANFCTEDFIDQLPRDLEMPMLPDEPLLSGPLMGLPMDDHHSDSSDSGIEFSQLMKNEPLSPSSSHCSDFSQDSIQSYGVSIPPGAATDLLTSETQLLEELGFHIGESTNQISAEETFSAVQVIKEELPNIVNIPERLCTTTSPHSPLTVNHDNVLRLSQNGGMSVVHIDDCDSLTPPVTPPSGVRIIRNGSVVNSGVGPPVTITSRPNGTGNIVKVIMAPQSKLNRETLSALSAKSPAMAKVHSSNTKVLPKPAVTTVPSTGASKTLVLTPEAFAKLTSQKLLSIKTNTQSSKPVMSTRVIPPYRQVPAVMSPISPSSFDPDVKIVKRQQRMMKNRESACLSRKRKKEYLSTLEDRIQEFTDENEKLKYENENLRKTVSFLQSENCKLKKTIPSSVIKASTVLLGVLLMVSLNLGPLMSIVPSPSLGKSAQNPSYADTIHHGRTLMSYDLPSDGSTDEFFNLRRLEREWNMLKQSLHLTRDDVPTGTSKNRDWTRTTGMMLAKHIDALASHAICPTHFNMTDSQRLLKELRGWVQGYEDEQKRKDKRHKDDLQQEQKRKKKPRNHNKKAPYQQKYMRANMDSGLRNMDYQSDQHLDYGVQVFTGREQTYTRFLKTLQRRNDTFYVVSFRQDHMLLPATAHNKTMRPRMSVVMPATGLNESMAPPEGSIAMMQIDCEVTATKLVHIQKSAVPEHLDPNVTNHDHPSMQQDLREEYLRDQAKKPYN